MAAMRLTSLVMILLLFAIVPLVNSSSLPFLDRRGSSSIERFTDPFHILEHIPFGLHREDTLAVSPARVDWKETPESHIIQVDVPGLKRLELKIEVEEKGILRVSGERKREEEKRDEKWHYVERTYGKFWRQFRLPENVDLDSFEAKLADGVLTVKVGKLAPEKVRNPKTHWWRKRRRREGTCDTWRAVNRIAWGWAFCVM